MSAATSDWIAPLRAALAAEGSALLVTVALARGSTPRETGAKMIVTPTAVHGSIGGGHLEFEAITLARKALSEQARGAWLLRFPLAARLGQCCGGVATLLFQRFDGPDGAWLDDAARRAETGERLALVTRIEAAVAPPLVLGADGLDQAALPPAVRSAAEGMLGGAPAAPVLDSDGWFVEQLQRSDFRVVLFGNGHVGRALAQILGTLPCSVAWVDQREEDFPANPAPNVKVVASDAPEDEVRRAAPGTMFLVMTHSHALDLDLCAAILRRDDFAYFGLIGSVSKRAQFERRLAARGVTAAALARMTCPIGLSILRGKAPGVIGVAVAAELLATHELRHATAAAANARQSIQLSGTRG